MTAQKTGLAVDDVPLGVCTWGLATDNPCLIYFARLNHTHRHLDARPYVFTDDRGATELFEGDVAPLRWTPSKSALHTNQDWQMINTDEARQEAATALSLAESASRGPWHGSAHEASTEAGYERFDHVVWGPFDLVCTAGVNEKRQALNDDTMFIADARTRVPALAGKLSAACDEIDQLRSLITELADELEGAQKGLCGEFHLDEYPDCDQSSQGGDCGKVRELVEDARGAVGENS